MNSNPRLPNTGFKLQQHQQQQQQQSVFNGFNSFNGFNDHDHLHSMYMKPDPGIEDWVGLHAGCVYGNSNGNGGGGDHDQLGYAYMMPNPGADQALFCNSSSVSVSVSVSPKKRKADDKGQSLEVVVTDKEKKIKGCSEGDSKITHQNSNSKEGSINTSSKEKSKVSEVRKPDYIHVRARRGQATDSHSLAERVRREKISERMKYLQDLVPGCNKITGKAGMLDEIINYVQSLQKQVEFLSMKLATVNPELDFDFDNVFAKEMFQASTREFASNSACFQLNSLDQVVSYCGLNMGITPAEMGLRRSISAPVSNPEPFMDSSCFNQLQPTANWDADLQNLYKMEFQQEPLIPFPSHQFTDFTEGSNLKTET